MNRSWQVAISAAILIGGCSDPPREPTSAAVEEAPAPVPSTNDHGRRLSVGSVSFTPPAGWEVRKLTEARVGIYAPDRPEWEEMEFRAKGALRKLPHPGVSLERFAEMLEATFAQSANQFSATVLEPARANAGYNAPVISLQEKGQFSIVDRELDGVRVLSTTFTGAFEFPRRVVVLKTYETQILHADALYSISLTFHQQFEDEMRTIWTDLEGSVRIAD